MKEKKTTIVNFILDESGSMNSIRDSVIDGFNEYIGGLKGQKNGAYLFTLTLFDSLHITSPYVLTPLKRVQPLSRKTYNPGAYTPLYDAVVQTIEKIEKKVEEDEPVIVAIMTDGAENASTKHNQKCLQDLIKKLQERGNWTFVFMGANQDSWATAKEWGIPKGNVMDWQATDSGTKNLMRGVMASTMAVGDFSASNVKSTVNFFHQAEEAKK